MPLNDSTAVGQVQYQWLPMGLCNSPDIFQEKMSELFVGLEYIREYIDDILVLTSGTWQDHLAKLEKVLEKFKDAGIKVNACKSFFGKTQSRIPGLPHHPRSEKVYQNKIKAMQAVEPPKTKQQLHQFISM